MAGYIEPEEPGIPEEVENRGTAITFPEDLATYIVENIGLDSAGFLCALWQSTHSSRGEAGQRSCSSDSVWLYGRRYLGAVTERLS